MVDVDTFVHFIVFNHYLCGAYSMPGDGSEDSEMDKTHKTHFHGAYSNGGDKHINLSLTYKNKSTQKKKLLNWNITELGFSGR